MELKVLTTNEMTTDEKKQVCELFEHVFKAEKTLDTFIHQFDKNEFGYSYIGLMIENDKIVGSYPIVPFKFKYFDKEVVFGQSVDAMIHEDFRNPFILKKLTNKVYDRLKAEEVDFVYGSPNDHFYMVTKKMLKWKDIYNLDIYLLPIRIGAVKNVLKPLDFSTQTLAKTLNIFVKEGVDLSESYEVYKQNSLKFENYRFTDEYTRIDLSENVYCFYKIQEFNNIRTAFIVDVFPLTKRNLELAVKKTYKTEKQIDLIAYFGFLPFAPINLFKVPEKYKPKNTHMAGRILNGDKINKDIFDIKNWRVNLSDFDWI